MNKTIVTHIHDSSDPDYHYFILINTILVSPLGLNIYDLGIKYTEKDWVRFKVRHYPLPIFFPAYGLYISHFLSFLFSQLHHCCCMEVISVESRSVNMNNDVLTCSSYEIKVGSVKPSSF